MMDKKELRKYGKNVLSHMSNDEKERASHLIYEHLFSHPYWKQSHTIGVTLSGEIEIDTTPILERGWKEGKRMAVPKCEPKQKGMTFYSYVQGDELETVYFGLKEPIEVSEKAINQSGLELILVPGLLFTKEGYRIGFGGGFYDRYLENYSGRTIGLATKQQLLSQMPVDSFDQPVDDVITEEGVSKRE
ncbi:hypothetical protein N781_05680 [Pontibacillus halophilus JSM 076056 = DSM 19796]|uniref:5-formyltetrahydrofolate cyclo-ligase n=1 Tax=Pontibacillus halophilus JSM 076056 = DSM 19796 TaxID=1385510 RepID=A0A0A5I4V1_9BACI|nr:5-formyltetrahydrofolate cyclo-ligase [Pontibacillus halophilus]KGX90862.1 hypothetical protein N781_05680 [Pontibacillus halophilus JSM 076056 = DSM 19796]